MKQRLLPIFALLLSGTACSYYRSAKGSVGAYIDRTRTHKIEETDIFTPHQHSLRPEMSSRRNIEVPLPDGTVLRGFAIIRLEPRANLIYFGGNAEMAQIATTKMMRMSEQYNANVICVDYRGYGASTGTPQVRHLASDALQVFDGTSELRGEMPNIVIGYSLGSIPAAYLAANRPLDGLVLMAPITSFDDGDMYPKKMRRKLKPVYRMPFARFIKVRPGFEIPEQTEPLYQIPQARAPLLLIHGEADDVVPPECGQKLFDLATGQKTLLILRGQGHGDVSILEGLGAVVMKEFLESLELRT